MKGPAREGTAGPSDLAIAQVERLLRNTGGRPATAAVTVSSSSRRPRPRRPGAGARGGPATRMPWCRPPGANRRPIRAGPWRSAASPPRPARLIRPAPAVLRLLGWPSSELSPVRQEPQDTSDAVPRQAPRLHPSPHRPEPDQLPHRTPLPHSRPPLPAGRRSPTGPGPPHPRSSVPATFAVDSATLFHVLIARIRDSTWASSCSSKRAAASA